MRRIVLNEDIKKYNEIKNKKTSWLMIVTKTKS